MAETGRERYYRQVREIRDELGISHDEARQRWSDYYAPGGTPIKPVKKVKLAIRASTSNRRTCPFCRDAIFHPDEGGPDYVCTSCQAHYHLDCFEDELQGKCATLGCMARRVISRARGRVRRQRPVAPPRAPERAPTVQEIDPEEYAQIRAQERLRASEGRPEVTPEEDQDGIFVQILKTLFDLAESSYGPVFCLVLLIAIAALFHAIMMSP